MLFLQFQKIGLFHLQKDYDENDPVKKNTQIANLLQDIMEIIM